METSTNLKNDSVTKIEEAIDIAVIKGDGIGPEIMDATLRILEAAQAPINPTFVEVGEKVYRSGNSSGIDQEAWEVIKRNKVILKAPITTPQGGGYKSLNVTMRKSLGLFANVRPVSSLHPYVQTHYPKMDVVIVRENEEDLYAGIEHRQTQDVYQCLKLITRPGSEKIVRYAFEYARAYGRKKVTCMVKDNIMKITDGLFQSVFDEVALEYPEIESETQIIDIGAARLASSPERYDVVVTPNLYGDIVSDIVAEIGGSVGMAGSANIGTSIAMFEAIHGSAPDIAGKGIANPSGLIQASAMMLAHLGYPQKADEIRNALLRTLEDGMHTGDIYQEGRSNTLCSTMEFAQQVIDRLGMQPQKLKPSTLSKGIGTINIHEPKRKVQSKRLVGVDVFIDWEQSDAHKIGSSLSNLDHEKLKLKMITNRGVKVYPEGFEQTYCTDHWRCRFTSGGNKIHEISNKDVISLLDHIHDASFDVIKTENLYEFDGVRAYSLGQGE